MQHACRGQGFGNRQRLAVAPLSPFQVATVYGDIGKVVEAVGNGKAAGGDLLFDSQTPPKILFGCGWVILFLSNDPKVTEANRYIHAIWRQLLADGQCLTIVLLGCNQITALLGYQPKVVQTDGDKNTARGKFLANE